MADYVEEKFWRNAQEIIIIFTENRWLTFLKKNSEEMH